MYGDVIKSLSSANKIMIEITDLSYGYKKDKDVLRNINLKIKEGETVAIVRKKWVWKIYFSKAYCRNRCGKEAEKFL